MAGSAYSLGEERGHARGLQEGRSAGLQRGRQEGRQEVVRELLEARFGDRAAALREGVALAGSDALDAVVRVLASRDPDEAVLARLEDLLARGGPSA